MDISAQNYRRTYVFPYLSFSCLIKMVILLGSITVPFFLTYSTPNFYLSSVLQVKETNQVQFTSQYHITITTDSSAFIYTNLFNYQSSRSISVTSREEDGNTIVGVQWPKSGITQKIKNVKITAFFKYNNTNNFGVAVGQISGYDIAQGSIMGHLTVKEGNGQNATTQTTFSRHSFNLQKSLDQSYHSESYLNFQYNTLPINLPSDRLKVEMGLNYSPFTRQHKKASVMAQLVWSWAQYFPVFLVLFFGLDWIFKFFLKEQIVKRRIIHDKEYLSLLKEK